MHAKSESPFDVVNQYLFSDPALLFLLSDLSVDCAGTMSCRID